MLTTPRGDYLLDWLFDCFLPWVQVLVFSFPTGVVFKHVEPVGGWLAQPRGLLALGMV